MFINRQGGTRSHQLWTLTKQMLLWCLSDGISLQAVHLPGKLNTIADLLSRLQDAPTEWTLSPRLVNLVWQRFGVQEVDFFAALNNHQLPRFCALTPGPGSVESRCFFDALGPPSGVRLSSLRNHTAGACKSGKRPVPAIVSGAKLARPDVVSSAHQPVGRNDRVPFRFPDDPNLVVLPVSRQPHPSPRGLHLTVWPVVSENWRAQGLWKDAAQMAAQSRRSSTLVMYSARLRSYGE